MDQFAKMAVEKKTKFWKIVFRIELKSKPLTTTCASKVNFGLTILKIWIFIHIREDLITDKNEKTSS